MIRQIKKTGQKALPGIIVAADSSKCMEDKRQILGKDKDPNQSQSVWDDRKGKAGRNEKL